MIKVEVPSPDSAAWKAWRAKAASAAQKLIDDGPPYEVDDDLYKEMKELLLECFHGKCAYCECDIRHSQPGDVEHFRPKKGVRDEEDRPVFIERGGAREKHPGYFWLAYEWSNLLPSCAGCNRLARVPGRGTIGKGERFPVLAEDGQPPFYAPGPGQEVDEVPVFIHPAREDPADHLEFDPKTALLIGRTARGQLCIDLLGLNRDALVQLRAQQYSAAMAKAQMVINAATLGDVGMASAFAAEIKNVKDGKAPFSLAGRKGLQDSRERLRSAMDQL